MSKAEALPPEELQLFIVSPDFRQKRAADKLARLPVPQPPIRGRRRLPGIGASPEVKPRPITEEAIVRLGKVLRHEDPLVDDITRYGRPKPDPKAIGRYVMGGNRRWKQSPQNADERQAALRQTMNIADSFQRNTRVKLDAARIYRAALSSVQASAKEGLPFNESAVNYASAAIEDFGVCLRGYPDIVKRAGSGEELPGAIEHIGVYAYEHPEILYEYPTVMRLVQIEQAKRQAGWQDLFDASMVELGDRSTQEDHQAEVYVDQLIVSFGVHDQPTA